MWNIFLAALKLTCIDKKKEMQLKPKIRNIKTKGKQLLGLDYVYLINHLLLSVHI
jgi:hypothetical protein